MHPDIKKFWEDHSHIIRYYDTRYHEVWYVDYVGYNICMLDKSKQSKLYYLDSKAYLEKDMLKVIKLKAFL